MSIALGIETEVFSYRECYHGKVCHIFQKGRKKKNAECRKWLERKCRKKMYWSRIETIKYKPRVYTGIPFPSVYDLKYANMPLEFSRSMNIFPFCSGGGSFI